MAPARSLLPGMRCSWASSQVASSSSRGFAKRWRTLAAARQARRRSAARCRTVRRSFRALLAQSAIRSPFPRRRSRGARAPSRRPRRRATRQAGRDRVDAAGCQHAREGRAGELRALIRVDDLRLAVTCQRLLQRLDAERCVHRDRQTPRQDPPREPVEHDREIDEDLGHRNACDVHRPDLIEPSQCAPDRDPEHRRHTASKAMRPGGRCACSTTAPRSTSSFPRVLPRARRRGCSSSVPTPSRHRVQADRGRPVEAPGDLRWRQARQEERRARNGASGHQARRAVAGGPCPGPSHRRRPRRERPASPAWPARPSSPACSSGCSSNPHPRRPSRRRWRPILSRNQLPSRRMAGWRS
jgi:hypothetical protein